MHDAVQQEIKVIKECFAKWSVTHCVLDEILHAHSKPISHELREGIYHVTIKEALALIPRVRLIVTEELEKSPHCKIGKLKGLGKDYSFLPLGIKYSACDDIQT